jgi:AcrR family transcriptional regulator
VQTVPVADEAPSARHAELLERAYEYVLRHGLSGLSLRPLAEAIGSSPGVLMFLFESKDGLVRALLARSRTAELELLAQVRAAGGGAAEVVGRLWDWLADPEHRGLLRLWAEGYGRSLVEPDGPWGGFAARGVRDWLALLGDILGPPEATTRATATLAVLRGALLDLLATDDAERTTAAVRAQLALLAPANSGRE